MYMPGAGTTLCDYSMKVLVVSRGLTGVDALPYSILVPEFMMESGSVFNF